MRVKIRKGDTVEIISGRLNDKGKRGLVIRVIPDTQRLVVQGVNLRKKNQKQVETQGRRSISPGIIEFEAPISISNVMLVCPTCSKITRVNLHRSEDGVKRACKQCNSEFD